MSIRLPVSEIMTKDVKTASETTAIRSVAHMMDKYDIGCIVIVKDRDMPSGIITERDVVRLVGGTEMSFSVHVREVMKSPVITVDVLASAKDALQTMQVKNIRRLPVMAKGRMVGIVTDKDIFRTILKSQDLLAEVISENFVVEYKPTYERLTDFMLGEMSHPGRR